MPRWNISWRLGGRLCRLTEQEAIHNGKNAAERLTSMWVCLLVLASACVWAGRPAFAQVSPGAFVTFDAPGAADTYPVAMSTTGAITGWFYSNTAPNQGFHAFARTAGGTVATFDAPGASTEIGTYPNAINAAGVISGYFFDENFYANFRIHGYVRGPSGGFATFDAPKAEDTFPTSLNSSGTIPGYYSDQNPNQNPVYHGFQRDAFGRFVTFDAPGAERGASQGTFSLAIQDDGVILGIYVDANSVSHGFLRSRDGSFITFDPPGGQPQLAAFYSYGPIPLSINPAGLVAGTYFETGSGNYRGFIRETDGSFVIFDAASYPPCCAWTFPFAMNPDGIITGYINDGNGINRGFVRARNGTVTIFDAPNAGTGFDQGTFATAIRPDGTIMGLDVDAGGIAHGFLLLKSPPIN